MFKNTAGSQLLQDHGHKCIMQKEDEVEEFDLLIMNRIYWREDMMILQKSAMILFLMSKLR